MPLETASPLLPIGAGRTVDKTWPGVQQNITNTAAGMTANITGRPGAGADYSGVTIVAYVGGAGGAVGSNQDNVPCYNLTATSAGPAGNGMGWQDRVRSPIGKFTKLQPPSSLACWRMLALIKGGFVGDSGADVGLQICQGTRFPSNNIFADGTSGMQFGPRGVARASLRVRYVQAGPLTLDLDVAAGFMANINPNAWNLWEVRILGATNQSNAVLKCLCNGLQVIPDQVIDAAGVLPGPLYAPNNSMFYTAGVVNRGADNSPNFYLGPVQWIAAPNETSLL